MTQEVIPYTHLGGSSSAGCAKWREAEAWTWLNPMGRGGTSVPAEPARGLAGADEASKFSAARRASVLGNWLGTRGNGHGPVTHLVRDAGIRWGIESLDQRRGFCTLKVEPKGVAFGLAGRTWANRPCRGSEHGGGGIKCRVYTLGACRRLWLAFLSVEKAVPQPALDGSHGNPATLDFASLCPNPRRKHAR